MIMKRVLLLGAGYANISLLKSLPLMQDTTITLISNNPYHYMSVLLHEVASGERGENVLFGLSGMFDEYINIIQDEILEIQHDKVIGKKNAYEYDILVIGLGFSSDTFGIPGIKEFTLSLVNYKEALVIYETLKQNLAAYKQTKDKSKLQIAVCGGGFSGSELSASLAQELPKMCAKEGIDPTLVKIYCIEAMPEILPMFPEPLSKAGRAYLSKLGVEVLSGSKILECKKGEVIIQNNQGTQSIFAETIIWTAGVKGNEVIEKSSFFESKRSRLEVDGFLNPINQKTPMDHIFVAGDCAAVLNKATQRFFPPTAQIALKQGEYLAKSLSAKLNDEPFSEEFHFESKGTFCSLGKYYGIGMTSNKTFKGKIAIWIKRFIELRWSYKISGLGGILRF